MYKVKDTGDKECYIVDLSDTANPCSCHQPKWQKVPCIHVIRVLNWREEFWRVWEYVGKEYTLERVEETCDFLNDKEFHLLKWIHNMLPEMSRGNTIRLFFGYILGIPPFCFLNHCYASLFLELLTRSLLYSVSRQ